MLLCHYCSIDQHPQLSAIHVMSWLYNPTNAATCMYMLCTMKLSSLFYVGKTHECVNWDINKSYSKCMHFFQLAINFVS